MGGEINWTALPTVVELFGFDDVGLLLAQLTAIRDKQARDQQCQSAS